MDKLTVLKTEWLITRKCFLKCSYCKIRDNNFPNELDLDGRKRVLDTVAKLSPESAVVIFGGEPLTLGDDLVEVVRHGVLNKLYMIVISNCVKLSESLIDKLYAAGLRNMSTSIDTLKENAVDKWTLERARTGLKGLLRCKEKGFNDLVTCTTVTKYNIEELPEMTEKLTELGIWSIHTLLQYGDENYDYSQGYENSKEFFVNDREKIERVSKKLAEMARSKKYLMHNIPEYYDNWTNFYDMKQNGKMWFCSKKAALTVDADGSLKRCVDWKGDVNKFKIFDLEDESKLNEYIEMLKKPAGCTLGCAPWDPAWQTAYMSEHYDTQKGVDFFKHDMVTMNAI